MKLVFISGLYFYSKRFYCNISGRTRGRSVGLEGHLVKRGRVIAGKEFEPSFAVISNKQKAQRTHTLC